jgi:hypothetical protein
MTARTGRPVQALTLGESGRAKKTPPGCEAGIQIPYFSRRRLDALRRPFGPNGASRALQHSTLPSRKAPSP